jgi:hypothetical protein
MKPMVFVLGAGASHPYGYPLAGELVDQIAYDEPADQSPVRLREDFAQLQTNLANAKARSVDVFLGRDSQQRFQEVGRLAIAEKLINCERHKAMFGRTTGTPNKQPHIVDDWYGYLFNTLTERIRTLGDVGNMPIAFVTFNYDRSLEYFLNVYLRSNFPANTNSEVDAVIAQIPIVHVYGALEPLSSRPGDGRPYNQTINAQTVTKAAEGITILHEGDSKGPEFSRVQDLFAQAYLIWILGFGYHPDNMRRLNLPLDRVDLPHNRVYIRGTAFGMTPGECEYIIHTHAPGKLVLSDPNHRITDALRASTLFLNCAR